MSLRRGEELSPVDVVIRYFFIKFLVKKYLCLSFELMKSNFTTVGPLENFFRPLHEKIHYFPKPWKIHLTRMLVCIVLYHYYA